MRPESFPRRPELIAKHADCSHRDRHAIEPLHHRPIADELGVRDLIANDIEEMDGVFTGKPSRHAHLPRGQVQRVAEWRRREGPQLADFENLVLTPHKPNPPS